MNHALVSLLLLSLLFVTNTHAQLRYNSDEMGEFSDTLPFELKTGDYADSNPLEEQLAETLQRGDTWRRVEAARHLWHGRSRRYATLVLQYVAGRPQGTDEFRSLQRQLDAETRPDSIKQELVQGNYQWGAWLAFLRPHKDFVPILVAALDDKPAFLNETMLALANSGDVRALGRLVDLLRTKDPSVAAFAAQALVYFGGPGAETALIKALSSDRLSVRLKACWALGMVGTDKAIPALETQARDATEPAVSLEAKESLKLITNRR